MKIDDLDLKIIKHLQDDARMSYRELGRKLGVPHTTIFTRAERLLKKGIIKKFSAILHPHDIGLQIGFIFVKASPSESSSIARTISEFDEVRHVFRTFDGKIIAKVVVPDHGQRGLEELLKKMNGYSMEVYPIHEVVKFDHTIHENTLESMKSE